MSYYDWSIQQTFPLVRDDLWLDAVTTGNLSWLNSQVCTTTEHPRFEQFEDKDGSLIIRFALAGYPKECLDVQHVDNVLIVKAEKVEDSSPSMVIAKRAFTKKFTDSRGVWNFSALKAVYKDGILTVTIPKKKEKEAIKVVIE